MAGLLSRARIVAPPGFNRWLVPPAALAIHLCIGQAYALSVFKIPLAQAIGITAPAPGDWSFSEIASIFQIAIFFLGLSAAFGGTWLERVGPRASGVAAALCWGTAFLVSALAVQLHNIWLLRLGYGVIGGCGLGLGYITPVSTLIKWFPDRRGMATGLAIMGFGGGAMIASPLSQQLMERFRTDTDVGIVSTFLTLGAVYAVAMLVGAFAFRVPAHDWKPEGWTPPATAAAKGAAYHVSAATAVKTRQFWLLWLVLFLNVTAGIGILEQAAPMIQELFKGSVTASAAAGYTGLLSLFNMGGRFFWSSISDRLGRKATYAVFFVLGPLLYLAIPTTAAMGSVALFVAATAIILTMYGGGFATIPAYLADTFGTHNVGAIHGRLLTAWSLAGLAGPELVNQLRASQLAAGVAPSEAYSLCMYLVAVLLVVGFVCNLFVGRVPEVYHMTADALAAERQAAAR
jgi:MFS family permease